MKGSRNLTIVIKLGTSSIVDEKTHDPLLSTIALIVDTACTLVKDGHRVVIVSSGAVGMGMRQMGIKKKPKSLAKVQALASNGQCQLISLWVNLFAVHRQEVNQILLTRNDIADQTQYRNARNTFTEAFNMGMIPIVNENDTIAVSEIRAIEKFGDNDTLSAITAAMVHADYLFLMTDVGALYDKNPRTNPDARVIEVVEDTSSLEADVSTSGSALGTGGMSTKIVAARLAASVGVTTIITRASDPGNILKIVSYLLSLKQYNRRSNPSPVPQTQPPSTDNEATSVDSTDGDTTLANSTSSLQLDATISKPPQHTRFKPDPNPIRDRPFWLLYGLAPHGTVFIDEGAFQALSNKAGLLPVGIVDVEGRFEQQEAVRLVVRRYPSPNTAFTGPASSNPDGPSSGGVPVEPGARPVPESAPEPGPELIPVEVGRALVNYTSSEIMRIKGCQSSEIGKLLKYADSEYVAFRENVSLLFREKGGRPVTLDRSVSTGPKG